MKAYKVTSKTNRSAVVFNTVIGVKYKKGQWTFPLVPNSELFVFKSFKSAKTYAAGKQKIWLCEVPSLKRITKCSDWDSSAAMKVFWESKKKLFGGYGVPAGSYTTPKIKLIKEVKSSYDCL